MQYRISQCIAMLTLATILALSSTRALAAAPETQPSDKKAPGAARTQPTSQPASQPSTQPAKPIPISFNKQPINQIAEWITKQLGKPVLISSEIEKVQITVVNPKPLPLEDAMYILRTALLEQGVAIEEREQTIHLVPVSQINSRQIPTIGPDGNLATIKPTNQIVRKIFEVKHYNVARLVDMIKPLLPPAYGELRADPSNGTLIIVATVEDLARISAIIRQLDKSDQAGRELRLFDVTNVDVYEIMPTLEKLISMFLGGDAKVVSAAGASDSSGGSGGGGRGRGGPGGPGGPGDRGGSGGGDRPGGPGGDKAGATAVIVQADQQKFTVFLSADPRRRVIMVEAAPSVLTQVEKWIKELDQPRPASTDLETVDVRFGDPDDLCAKLTAMINGMPDDTLRQAVRVFPFPASRKLMIRGTEQNRRIVKDLLAQIDVDTGQAVTRTFPIKYADATEIAENIKDLFTEQKKSSFWDDYYSSSRGKENDYGKVTVTANIRRNTITVVTSPEKLKRIEEQITLWDTPLTGDEASPRIYTIKYADPEKVREMLENLFTKKEKSATPWWWSSNSEPAGTPSPVGRLFGQFRFEAYPDLGKLVVVSKNEENYAVIDDLLERIDTPQTAGLPHVIQLKYAFAEPMAEQLNALLNAPGTPTSVVRRDQTPTNTAATNNHQDSPYGASSNNNGNNNNSQQQYNSQQQQGQMEQGIMRFWWQYIRQDVKDKQPSNLIGKMRIVPNIEQNLLLVTAPEGNAQAIEDMVRDLDKPGHQVFIKAVIAEITHEDATSLGYRFSSDPTIFQTGDPFINENALKGLFTYKFQDSDSHNAITFDMDVHNLISALRRITDIKIKSEPSLMVYDNIEGEFFDGQDIPFLTNSNTPSVGGLVQSFDYKPVGITLRVRPHITKEGSVAMTVNITASSIVPGQMLFGSYIIDRRETNQHVVLENGRTFMISGMLRSEDHTIIRRIPGLGDIPGIGELFKHREIAKVNTELLIFLTPHVITPENASDMIERKPLNRLREKNMLPDDMQAPDDTAPSTTRPTDVPPDYGKALPATQPQIEPASGKPAQLLPIKKGTTKPTRSHSLARAGGPSND